MSQLIKFPILTRGLVLIAFSSGCGDSQAEKAAKERQREQLEAEKQAQADADRANKAITANNQKMFSRMNASSPGATTTQSTQPNAPEKK